MGIVAIEGADGAGKDTVAKALSRILGCKVINFPNDQGHTGPLIRDYLAKKWWVERVSDETVTVGGSEAIVCPAEDLKASAMAFQALNVANRLELMPEILAAKDVVLVRSWQSGWVYGQLDGLDEKWLELVSAALPQADCNILLDIDAYTSVARVGSRGEGLERYEGDTDTSEVIVALYRDLWNRKRTEREVSSGIIDLDHGSWPIIDATQDVGSVIGDTCRAVLTRFLRTECTLAEARDA